MTEAEKKYQREYKRKCRANPAWVAHRREVIKRWRLKNLERCRMMERASGERRKEQRAAQMRLARQQNPIGPLLVGARGRAKKAGVPFSITAADVPIPEFCPVLGLRIRAGGGRGYDPCSPSIDRIIPSLGYVPGNVRVISHRANELKRDATPDELIRVANWLVKETARIKAG